MEEFDWYREELDGRKQCPSQHRETLAGDYHPRCRLEVGHALDHAGDGWSWSDDQELKPSRFDIDKILKVINVVLWFCALAFFIYAIFQLITDYRSPVPRWWVVGAYGTGVLIVIETVLNNRRKR